MALADLAALTAATGTLLGTTWALADASSQDAAANEALRELGWVLPESDTAKTYWMIERTKRHFLYLLLTQHAERFRYKQIHLQQRFNNYFQLITMADTAFAAAMDNDVSGLFTSALGNLDAIAKVGFLYNPAGFVYNQLGQDLTYVD